MKEFAVKVRNQMINKMLKIQSVLSSREAEGFVDTAIKILMAVVIGALILAGLYALFGNTTEKVRH